MLDWNTRGEEIIWRTSEEIARMLKKQGKEKEAEDCIVRVATIQDKAGRGASWGFAFVELVTSEVSPVVLDKILELITDISVGSRTAVFSIIATEPTAWFPDCEPPDRHFVRQPRCIRPSTRWSTWRPILASGDPKWRYRQRDCQ
jgi:hypothetical protein